ncbi:MAG: hypothetical protein WBV43_03945 [Pseudolabrys sp.]|jgi:hypothetical protein
MAGIPVLVQQGLNTEAIAARLGCKVGTLKVRCSQAQISLRGPKKVKTVPLVPAPKPPKQKRSFDLALQLSRAAMSENLGGAAFARAVREEFKPADFSVVVKRRGKPSKPWRWEIYCACKAVPIERSPVFFESATAAAKEGKKALTHLLAK